MTDEHAWRQSRPHRMVTVACGAGVHLTEVVDEDMAWLDGALDHWDRSQRWSVRGGPATDVVVDLTHDGVHRQRVVWADRDTPVGLLQLVDVDMSDDVGALELLVDPGRARANERGLVAFLADAFDALPLRKVVVRAFDDDLDVAAFLGGACSVVGRYRAHQRRSEDAFADLLHYEVWRPGP